MEKKCGLTDTRDFQMRDWYQRAHPGF